MADKADKSARVMEEPTVFQVVCTGQLSDGTFGTDNGLYCRYSFHWGPDWSVMSGVDTGLSQIARRNPSNPNDRLVWNFPIDISFKTTNVYGWPRVAVSVYGLDFAGRDVVRGYGSALVPLVPGVHEIVVDCYVPMASSWFNELMAWFFGNPPEFYDSKVVCQADGREVTRVKSTGRVRIKMNVSTKGMSAIGYSSSDTEAIKIPKGQAIVIEQK